MGLEGEEGEDEEVGRGWSVLELGLGDWTRGVWERWVWTRDARCEELNRT